MHGKAHLNVKSKTRYFAKYLLSTMFAAQHKQQLKFTTFNIHNYQILHNLQSKFQLVFNILN